VRTIPRKDNRRQEVQDLKEERQRKKKKRKN
jgi:hypothetical protein